MTIRKDPRLEAVPVAVVLGAQHHPVREHTDRMGLHLHLNVRVHGDVEHLAMPREPRVRPPAVVADPDRRNAFTTRTGTGSPPITPILPRRRSATLESGPHTAPGNGITVPNKTHGTHMAWHR
jgi:hypothetical protein